MRNVPISHSHTLRPRLAMGARMVAGRSEVTMPAPAFDTLQSLSSQMSAPARRRSIPVRIGSMTVGGGAPIVVQSMTNTDTADIEATTGQIKSLARAGSELVRVTVNTDEAAAAVPHVRDRLAREGVFTPLVGDFHFNGHRLLQGASCVRRSSRKISHQSRQRRSGQQARSAVRGDDRSRLSQRETGTYRRQLGQPRSGAAHPTHG